MAEPISTGYRAEELFEIQVTLTHGLERGCIGISLEITGMATNPIQEGILSSPIDIADVPETIFHGLSGWPVSHSTMLGLLDAVGIFRETGDIGVVDTAIVQTERMIAMYQDDQYSLSDVECVLWLERVLDILSFWKKMSTGQVSCTKIRLGLF